MTPASPRRRSDRPDPPRPYRASLRLLVPLAAEGGTFGSAREAAARVDPKSSLAARLRRPDGDEWWERQWQRAVRLADPGRRRRRLEAQWVALALNTPFENPAGPVDRAVALGIVEECLSHGTPQVRVGRGELAAELGLTEWRVREALERLSDRGLVACTSPSSGGLTPNRWRPTVRSKLPAQLEPLFAHSVYGVVRVLAAPSHILSPSADGSPDPDGAAWANRLDEAVGPAWAVRHPVWRPSGLGPAAHWVACALLAGGELDLEGLAGYMGVVPAITQGIRALVRHGLAAGAGDGRYALVSSGAELAERLGSVAVSTGAAEDLAQARRARAAAVERRRVQVGQHVRVQANQRAVRAALSLLGERDDLVSPWDLTREVCGAELVNAEREAATEKLAEAVGECVGDALLMTRRAGMLGGFDEEDVGWVCRHVVAGLGAPEEWAAAGTLEDVAKLAVEVGLERAGMGEREEE